MTNIFLCIVIGIIIGTIDIVPMIIKKLDIMFILSAFSLWIVVTILSGNLNIIGNQILNGLVFSILVFIPLSFLIYRVDSGAFIQVLITTVIFGLLVGLLTGLFIK